MRSAAEKRRHPLRDALASLEFSPHVGTRRLPKLTPEYESSLRGLYIVGDLADAPVIKIAVRQGYDVVDRLAQSDLVALRSKGGAGEGVSDVVIVGAGPAGIGAALACKKHGLSFELVDRVRPFDTIQSLPKGKPIFAEPHDVEDPESGVDGQSRLPEDREWLARFPLDDAPKEELIEAWQRALVANDLVVRAPEDVVDIVKAKDHFEVHSIGGSGEPRVRRARRVVLAIGRQANPNKLGVPGEDAPKVQYALADPEAHRGERVLVVGGGDSAVEAAIALSRAGAAVTISYRQDGFARARQKNKAEIEALIQSGAIRAIFSSKLTEIHEGTVVIEGPSGALTLENDRVFVLIGTSLPTAFLDKIGVGLEGAFSIQRTLWLLGFALATYFFYVLKTKHPFFPFGPRDPLGGVPAALQVPFGTYVDGSPRHLDGGFFGTVIYSLMITVFGIQAILKYRSPIQTKRYLCLIGFQLVFLFAIPELVAPLLIARPWRMYSLSVPWPLSIWSLYHSEPAWFALGAGVAFVGVPLFVRYHGERFCSWACGCGGLAETLGDRWRHLAPRGRTSVTAEVAGQVVFVLATITTFLILGHDIWGFLDGPVWSSAKQFAQSWYGLMVDFWFACIVGVGFYPYLGNRVWCRFLCPLRAYMELLSKWFGRLKITANERCIGCGECTRYCQMGIPVQRFAQRQEDFANHNSACIHCGICVEVCPLDVLSVVRAPQSTRVEARLARGSHPALPIVTGP